MPVVSSQLPTAYSDNTSVGVANRGGKYGEQYVSPIFVSKHIAADEGSYFVTTNPTPQTALASGVLANYAATSGLFVVYNSDVAGGKNIYLDYLRITPTVAPASGTSMHFALWLDKQNLYSSGGTAMVPVNASTNSARTSVATINASSGGTVLTLAALTSNKRLAGRGVARSVIPAIFDEIVIQFGGFGDSGTSSATAAGRSAVVAPPVVLAPGWSLSLNHWFPSNAATGLSYEFEIGHIER